MLNSDLLITREYYGTLWIVIFTVLDNVCEIVAAWMIRNSCWDFFSSLQFLYAMLHFHSVLSDLKTRKV